MSGNDWTTITTSPLDAGFAASDVILVWHVYQGVMVIPCEKYATNPFFTHWRGVDENAWVKRAERMPGKKDADPLNCVIARDELGNVVVTGWHRVDDDGDFTQWQTPPPPPTANCK